MLTAGPSAQADAVRAAGVAVEYLPASTGADEALAALRAAAGGSAAVWLASEALDLGRLLAQRLGSGVETDDVEVVYGSWDPPGARLLDLVAVMDRLRSPGGCPWDAEQTHDSLRPYLLEEAYEAYDALVDGDAAALREELGDVLLQVAFHARLAAERAPDGADYEDGDEADGWAGQPGFDIDDVAGDLVAKLVRRHPHVFAGREVTSADEVNTNWESIKRAEKGRESALDGVARSQPALSLAAKYLSRATRAGVDVAYPVGRAAPVPVDDVQLGDALFALVVAGSSAGLDPEAALRAAADRYAAEVRAAEGAES